MEIEQRPLYFTTAQVIDLIQAVSGVTDHVESGTLPSQTTKSLFNRSYTDLFQLQLALASASEFESTAFATLSPSSSASTPALFPTSTASQAHPKTNMKTTTSSSNRGAKSRKLKETQKYQSLIQNLNTTHSALVVPTTNAKSSMSSVLSAALPAAQPSGLFTLRPANASEQFFHPLRASPTPSRLSSTQSLQAKSIPISATSGLSPAPVVSLHPYCKPFDAPGPAPLQAPPTSPQPHSTGEHTAFPVNVLGGTRRLQSMQKLF